MHVVIVVPGLLVGIFSAGVAGLAMLCVAVGTVLWSWIMVPETLVRKDGASYSSAASADADIAPAKSSTATATATENA